MTPKDAFRQALDDCEARNAKLYAEDVSRMFYCEHEWKPSGHWRKFQNEPTWYDSYLKCIKCDATKEVES